MNMIFKSKRIFRKEVFIVFILIILFFAIDFGYSELCENGYFDRSYKNLDDVSEIHRVFRTHHCRGIIPCLIDRIWYRIELKDEKEIF